MGCGETKQSSSEVEDPTLDLIKIIFDSLSTSRNNLTCFEPTYYFLNQILQKSLQKNEVSKIISKELKKFQTNLPKNLQEPLNEAAFLKSILPVQTVYNSLYLYSPFDWQSKMKKVEGISSIYVKEQDILEDFFLNEPAQFWLRNFIKKENTSFSDFFERFTPDYMQIFDQDYNSLPATKRVDLNVFQENIKLLLKYELESNNNLTVSREGWNVFSFKTLFNYTARSQFIDKACVVPKNNSNRLTLRFIYFDCEVLEQNDQKEYIISQEGLDLNGENPMKVKDMLHEKISVGRNVENDIKFDGKDVSRKHFLISMKKALKGDKISNEYYVSNVSKSAYMYFVVEAEGYLLAKNLIISLTESKQFFIRDIYPPFSQKTDYLSVEPEFLGAKIQPMVNGMKPFIEIEFLDDQMRTNFQVPNEDEDFTFTIGSGPDNSVKVNDIEDGDEGIYPDHCNIKYDANNKCWIVQDKTVVQPGDITFYKTLIKCENEGQYEDFVEMRGIRLMDKMKVFFGNCALSVNEKID